MDQVHLKIHVTKYHFNFFTFFSTFWGSFRGNPITATVLQYPYYYSKTVKAILFLIQAVQPNNIKWAISSSWPPRYNFTQTQADVRWGRTLKSVQTFIHPLAPCSMTSFPLTPCFLFEIKLALHQLLHHKISGYVCNKCGIGFDFSPHCFY